MLSLEEDDIERIVLNNLALGETQSGVNRHLETKVLGSCSKED